MDKNLLKLSDKIGHSIFKAMQNGGGICEFLRFMEIPFKVEYLFELSSLTAAFALCDSTNKRRIYYNNNDLDFKNFLSIRIWELDAQIGGWEKAKNSKKFNKLCGRLEDLKRDIENFTNRK